MVISYDAKFYEQPQIGALRKLAATAAAERRPPGWSTITFAVMRDCLHFLAPDCCRGIDWIGGSWVFMGRVERAFPRDRILEIYLNDSYLGRGTYGVTAASRAYFGKNLEALDVDEIAFLVMRFRLPGRAPSHTKEQRDFTIDRMFAAGLIDGLQATAAKAAQLPWLDNQPNDL